MNLLDSPGFVGRCNFAYLPVNLDTVTDNPCVREHAQPGGCGPVLPDLPRLLSLGSAQ